MTRRLLAVAAALAVCIGSMCWIFVNVDSEAEALTYWEEVISGDPIHAQGLRILSHSQEDELNWHTEYTVGSSGQTKTQFVYGETYEDNTPSYEGVTMAAVVTSDWDYLDKDSPTGLQSAIQEQLEQTQPGQRKQEWVYLKDYYEYYPLELTIDLPGNTVTTHDYIYRNALADSTGKYQVVPAFSEYFKIPVLPKHTVEIETYVSPSGNSTTCGYNDQRNSLGYRMNTVCAVGEEACYFTFDCHYTEDEIVDVSHLPEGFGIFCLPYAMENGAAVIKHQELSMVYSLDPTVEILALQADGDKLLLHTREDGWYTITVIDMLSMQTLQKLRICPLEDAYTGLVLYENGDFFCVLLNSEKLVLVSNEKNGLYQYQFSVDMKEFYFLGLHETVFWGYGPGFAFDGEKLAIVSYALDERWHSATCDLDIKVFDAAGMIYQGWYHSSLNRPLQGLDHVGSVQWMPIEASWS